MRPNSDWISSRSANATLSPRRFLSPAMRRNSSRAPRARPRGTSPRSRERSTASAAGRARGMGRLGLEGVHEAIRHEGIAKLEVDTAGRAETRDLPVLVQEYVLARGVDQDLPARRRAVLMDLADRGEPSRMVRAAAECPAPVHTPAALLRHDLAQTARAGDDERLRVVEDLARLGLRRKPPTRPMPPPLPTNQPIVPSSAAASSRRPCSQARRARAPQAWPAAAGGTGRARRDRRRARPAGAPRRRTPRASRPPPRTVGQAPRGCPRRAWQRTGRVRSVHGRSLRVLSTAFQNSGRRGRQVSFRRSLGDEAATDAVGVHDPFIYSAEPRPPPPSPRFSAG